MNKSLNSQYKMIVLETIDNPIQSFQPRRLSIVELNPVTLFEISENQIVTQCALNNLVRIRWNSKHKFKAPSGLKGKTKSYGEFLDKLLDVVLECDFGGLYSDGQLTSRQIFGEMYRELCLVGLARFTSNIYTDKEIPNSKDKAFNLCSHICSKVKNLDPIHEPLAQYEDGSYSFLIWTVHQSIQLSLDGDRYRQKYHAPMVRAWIKVLRDLEKYGAISTAVGGKELYRATGKHNRNRQRVNLSEIEAILSVPGRV